MADVEVSAETRKKLTDKLGLPVQASNAEIEAALTARLDAQAESSVSAAISGGKILAEHGEYWRAAFARDHWGTKKVLDSLSSPAAAAASSSSARTPGESTSREPVTGAFVNSNYRAAADPGSEYELTCETQHLAAAGYSQPQQFHRGNRLTGVHQHDIDRLVRAGAAKKVGAMDAARDWRHE